MQKKPTAFTKNYIFQLTIGEKIFEVKHCRNSLDASVCKKKLAKKLLKKGKCVTEVSITDVFSFSFQNLNEKIVFDTKRLTR